MQQYQNVLQDKFGNVIVGASVAVYVYGTTTPATIYSGNGTGLLPSNTVTTSSLGEFAFYAANGRYSLSITATNFVAESYSDFILYDPADIGAVTASGVAFTPFGTVAATNVQNAIQEVVTDLSASSGSSLVGFLQSGTGAQARTVQAKLRETVSVKDFGAVGDGISDDTAAFTAAKNARGSDPVFIPSANYKWKLTSFVDGNFTSDGFPAFVGSGYVKFKTVQGNSVNDNNNGVVGLCFNNPSILVLGDSISYGSGATSLKNGYSFLLARSIMNAVNNGPQNDPGYGYHAIVNSAQSIASTSFTTTGSYSATGVVNSRISLAAGQSITLTGISVSTLYVFYDGAVSSGNLTFSLNGAAVWSTVAVSGASINNTGAVAVPRTTIASDTITVAASGGTVVVTAIQTLKTSATSPLMWVAAQSGTTFGDYTGAAAIAELAYYLNFARSGNAKILHLALGTNSIYNAGKSTTPTQMITDMSTIIAGIKAACTNVQVVLHIPPRANEATFPVINSSYTYADYVLAFENYARTNSATLIRHDMSAVSYAGMYADGVHPNDYGHLVMAESACSVYGVNLNPYINSVTTYNTNNLQTNITYNSTWRSFLNDPLYRVVATYNSQQNSVQLSGIAEPNGSVSTTVGNLPAGYRPVGRTCYFTSRSDSGAALLSIDTFGNIVLSVVPGTWFSFEGVNFTLTRP